MTRRHRGFSIVELLVVIGIIGLLIGLLFPALSGVRARGRKATEMNHVRTMGQAWVLYANANNDACIPAYVDEDTINAWRMRPAFPDKTDMPPGVAGPWTWRLMPFFNNNAEVVHHYTGHDDDLLTLQAEAQEAAFTPAFGYNGVYVGGVFEVVDVQSSDGTVDSRPMPRYWNATNQNGKRIDVTRRSISQINNSTTLTIFCSSGNRPAGVYKRALIDDEGSYLVDAPIEADVAKWGRVSAGVGGGGGGGTDAGVGAGDYSTVEAFTTANIPIGRHTGQAAIFFADGHTGVDGPGTMADQRKFIDIAEARDWTHTP